MNEIEQPSVEDIGDFPHNVYWAGWALFNDSDNKALWDWVDANEETWSEMEQAKPTGWTMAGAFDMYSPPQVGDFLVAGLFCHGDPKTWIAFA